jgi:23S rRNA A2030 N6-methylase RlmJ
MSSVRAWFIIRVTGYGAFAYYGTKEDAEDKRAAKAEWEGGVGRIEQADPTNTMHREMVAQEQKQRVEFRAKGYPGYEEDFPELVA